MGILLRTTVRRQIVRPIDKWKNAASDIVGESGESDDPARIESRRRRWTGSAGSALNDSFNFRDRPRPRELDPFLFSPRRGEKDYLYRQRVPSIYLLTGLGFATGSDSARVSAGRDRIFRSSCFL